MVRTLLVTESSLYAAGEFNTVNGAAAGGLVRLSLGGVVDSAFSAALGSGLNGWPVVLATQANGALIVGGDFGAVDGESRVSIARIGASGALDPFFAGNADASP